MESLLATLDDRVSTGSSILAAFGSLAPSHETDVSGKKVLATTLDDRVSTGSSIALANLQPPTLSVRDPKPPTLLFFRT